MARVNVYLPDDLAAAARDAGLNVSSLTQDALRAALATQRTDVWLDQLAADAPSGVRHEDVALAIAEAKNELSGE
ncbi:MAG: type II toxin-antitoxin system CcdA family antitoxin [Actinomycetota bacterium]|nr:type II toxin-antitoxin system CcdA family antitoxin [Actinomycetota bacterium]